MSSVIDRVQGRRTPDWYIGKVLHVTGGGCPGGWTEGYYVPTKATATAIQDCRNIGARPSGVPIYKLDGVHRDLRAEPSTVVPSIGTWLLWPLVWLVVAVVGYQFMYDAGWFLGIVESPILLIPFAFWFLAIEPVRATRLFALIGLGLVALDIHRHFEDKRYLDHTYYQPQAQVPPQ